MLRARILSMSLGAAMLLSVAAVVSPAAADTTTPQADVPTVLPLSFGDSGTDSGCTPSLECPSVARVSDSWVNSWQGWDIDSGGPSTLLVRR